jgi:hypothetical protein
MEMVICQETPSHGKNIYGNLTAARHAPSKKVRYTRYYRFLRCAFLSVKQNYGKIRPRRAAVVCLPMSNLFSISKILSGPIYIYIYVLYSYIPVIFPSNPIALGRCPKMGGTPIVIWGSCILGNLHQNLGEINHHYIPRKSLYLFVKSAFWGFLKFFGDPKSP